MSKGRRYHLVDCIAATLLQEDVHTTQIPQLNDSRGTIHLAYSYVYQTEKQFHVIAFRGSVGNLLAGPLLQWLAYGWDEVSTSCLCLSDARVCVI